MTLNYTQSIPGCATEFRKLTNQEFEGRGEYLAMARTVFDTELRYLARLRDSIGESFERAVQTLLSVHGKLVVSGIGKSGVAAQKISSSFTSIGLPSLFLNSGEAIHGDLGVIAAGDAVLLLSVGGNSAELSSIIRYCKRLSVPILSIVGNKDSALYKASDTALLLPNFSEVTLKVPSTSFTMTCLLGDALLACVVEARNVSLVQYKSYHPGGSIGSSLVQVKEIMRTREAMPVVQFGTLMAEALIQMTSKSLGCVVVVTPEAEIGGIITDGDLRRHMSDSLINMRVEEVMTSNPHVIDADSFLLNALAHMHKMKVTNLIVVSNKKLVGIVHIHDCLKLDLEASDS